MITVRCLGHIGTALGSKELAIEASEIAPSDLVERVRGATGKRDPGFSIYNTLVMVDDGEAFVPAAASKPVVDGARVVLIPFSHGG